MAGDLGRDGSQVHRAAEAVLHFWFREVPADRRFARDDAIDAEIHRRFGALRRETIEVPERWADDPRTLLAAVILIDQFSRNLFRDDAEAFAGDAAARALADTAIVREWDRTMTPEERLFLYLPFMHSEALADQDRAVALLGAIGDPMTLDFARRHRDQIVRFGRFPQRNAALGRVSAHEETVFLEDPANRF